VAFQISDSKDMPCLIQVYSAKNEDLWENTKNIHSLFSSDYVHENILPYLWSAKGECLLVNILFLQQN
jgi:ferric iron reductase protein FhuF